MESTTGGFRPAASLRAVTVAALLALGCHSEPFQPANQDTLGPFQPGNPTRVTLNPGKDLHPAWLPDGSAFLYAFEALRPATVAGADRCLGLMPATLGTLQRVLCDPSPGASSSLDAFDVPAVSTDGQLAYTQARSILGAVAPSSQAFNVAPLAAFLAGRVVTSLPFTLPGGQLYGGLSQPRWLGPTRLIFLAEQVQYPRPCAGCIPDTLASGLDIISADLSLPTPVLQAVPGTQNATSVAAVENSSIIYFTLIGDSRAYRLDLSGGGPSVAHDFGALGIARDVQVRGNTLVAVVGGKVSVENHPIYGLVQHDQGGVLRQVDLASGAESPIAANLLLFRHPALRPTGAGLVAEGYAMTIGTNPSGMPDTTVAAVGDLWWFGAP